jgi:hypothetical protein
VGTKRTKDLPKTQFLKVEIEKTFCQNVFIKMFQMFFAAAGQGISTSKKLVFVP